MNVQALINKGLADANFELILSILWGSEQGIPYFGIRIAIGLELESNRRIYWDNYHADIEWSDDDQPIRPALEVLSDVIRGC